MTEVLREVSAITVTQARNWIAQPKEAMISIVGSGEAPVDLKRGWAFVLRLTFDDIVAPQRGLKLFSQKDACVVNRFLNEIEGKVVHIVSHCMFGQSRSPAIARYISDRYDVSNGWRYYERFNKHVYKMLATEYEKDSGESMNAPALIRGNPRYSMGTLMFGRQRRKR